jgi:hypothetical protein
MPANNSSSVIHFWAGKYPGKVGWLVGPSAMSKTKLRPWMPFALDNDAFSSWTTGREWSEDNWIRMLDAVAKTGLHPRWILVPDVVADKEATLQKWKRYAPVARQFNWPLAIAVQDGMTPSDLPDDVDVIFVGGTTEWKWNTLCSWVETKKTVHVGRVNEISKVLVCEFFGVESVDGTGWMRGTENGRQATDLKSWVEDTLPAETLQKAYREYLDLLL